jgi:hypothetical protein
MCGSFASEREGKWEKPRSGCRIGAEKRHLKTAAWEQRPVKQAAGKLQVE